MTTVHWPSTARSGLGDWVRGRFVEINSALEDLYWDSADRNSTEPGPELQSELLRTGEELIAQLTNDDLTGGDWDDRFSLLGEVGMFISAVRRHEVERTDGGPNEESPVAASVAIQLGASLGVAPRFLTAHNQTHNLAVDGRYRTFTSGESEALFTDYNTRSVYAYMRAADALVRAAPLGVSHPVTHDLLMDAANAVRHGVELNRELSERLDVDELFFRVRPYLKPCQIGRTLFRGNNAGDFAAFNEIDTILGLCSMSDSHYAQIVAEKLPYLVPSERSRLRQSLRSPNLLDGFVSEFVAADEPWFQKNASAFLDVLDVLGEGARHHHDDIVNNFITTPTAAIEAQHKDRITASGSPLDVLIASLERLRDQRSAAPRDDVPTRHDDVQKLRSLVR